MMNSHRWVAKLTLVFLTYVCNGAVLSTQSQPTKANGNVKLNISSSGDSFLCRDRFYYNSYNNGETYIRTDPTFNNCSLVLGEDDKRSLPLDLTGDGYLHLNGKYIAPGQFCISENSTTKLCSLQATARMWKKCCPENQVINLTSPNACTNASSHPFRLKFNEESQSFSVINIKLAAFSCPKGFHLKKLSTNTCSARSMTSYFPWFNNLLDKPRMAHDRFRAELNGTMMYEVATGVFLRKSQWKQLDLNSDHYCVDGVLKPSTTDCGLENQDEIDNLSRQANMDSPHYKCQQNDEDQQILYICIRDELLDEVDDENIQTKTIALAVIWSFTCPLLFGAAIVNSCVIQKNVHGWILTCYLLSMVILNIMSSLAVLNPGQSHEGCRPADFFTKFMYMSTVCWMTSINFGLWKTFRYTLPKPVGIRRFTMSVIFSLGCPAISVTVCYYVAYMGTDEHCRSEYCLLYSYSTIPFFSVPIFLLVLGNFAIFLKTSCTITSLRKVAEEVLQRQAQDHLDSFALFTKLFLLTGSIWLLRLALFILQVQGLYLSWYGVILEGVFSIPEVIFPMIVFHDVQFIKWSWNRFPSLSRIISTCDPLFHSSRK